MTTANKNDTVLVFRPRPSLGWLWLGSLGLAVAGLGLVTLLNPMVKMPVPLLIINVGLPLSIGLPMLALAAWFPTMRYEMDGRTLALRHGPVLHYRIPLVEIKSVRRRDLAISLWSSLRLPGLALFSVPTAMWAR